MAAAEKWPLRTWVLGICVVVAGWASGLSAQQWKIMPIGNSITAGVGSSSGAGYRPFLYNKLQGVDFALVGPNGAAPYNGHFVAGAKIEDFYAGGYGNATRDVAPSMNAYRPEILLIHLGTNNMNNDAAGPYSVNAGISLEKTASGKLAEFLRYVSQWSNGTRGDFLKRIVVCKIVPRLVYGSPDAKVGEYNAEIDRMFFENAPGIAFSKVTLVDMNSVVLISDLGDGTHPTDAGYSKMADEYSRIVRGIIAGDTYPPAANSWLGALALDSRTAGLQWQAVGDDGLNGLANLYEMRYAAFELSSANFSQGILVSLPKPAASGTRESRSVSGLVPGLSYFFGIRTYDELNNRGPLAFSPPIDMNDTTSTEYCDDFIDAAAINWALNPAYRIDMVRGELVNSSTSSGWDYLATYKAARYTSAVRGVRAAMQWSELSDAGGINASGIAMMLNSPTPQASGYMVRVRNRVIYLHEIVNGSINTADIRRSPFPTGAADPKPGDILEVKFNPSITNGHSFNVYLNRNYLGDVYDTARRQGSSSQLYSGIVLYGGLNNAIDNFCLEVPPLSPDSMYAVAGEGKHGKVTQRLAEPLAVRVVDANNIPVSDVQVEFRVVSGQASLSTDSLDVTFNGNIWQEAEGGDLEVPYVTGSSAEASGSEYIYVPAITGNNYRGLAIYQIYVPKAGSYLLWLRGYAADGLQNSCYFSFGADTLQMNFSNYKVWDWVSWGKSIALPKGFSRLTIKNRESGLQLDKMLLTSNASYRPAGVGQSTQRFSNITDATGSAYTFISFSQSAGQVLVRASAPAVPNGSELNFNIFADALDPHALQYASETILTGVAGQPLEKDFAAQLQDQYGNYCVGVPVEFSVTEGDGRFSRQNTIRVSSNSEGIAGARLTLGYAAAGSKISAALPDLPAVPALTFQAIAGEGIPVSISMISGDAQIDTVGQLLQQPLVVQVLDEKSRPVLKYPVAFVVIRNNGSLNGSGSTVIDSTDSFGKARVTWTLGDTAGTSNNVVRIDAPLNGAPLHFTASALPERPALMTIVSGDNQQGYAGEELAQPLVVKISDRFGNGRANQTVTFSVVTGGGSFSGSTPAVVTTDTLGHAAVVFHAGTRTGLHQIEADANPGLGIGARVFASIMISSPRATQMSVVSGVGQEGIVLTALAQPFKIKVTNPFGEPVANINIRFKVVAGGGQFNGLDSLQTATQSGGEAQALLTLGSLAGADRQRIVVSAPGLTIPPLELTATALPGLAESIEPATDLTFREQAETTVPITVIVKDAYGNPKSGHMIAFTVAQGNGSFSSGGTYLEVNSNGGGQATVQYKMGTSASIENIIAVSSARSGSSQQLTGSPVLFSGRVVAGTPRQLAQITAATGLGAKILSTLPQPFIVEARDTFGNPSPQSLIINFKIIAGGGKFGSETELDRLTDATGQAFALLKVGSVAGSNNNIVRVTVRDHPEILPVDFMASAYPGDPDQLFFGGDSLWNGRVLTDYTAYAVVKDIMGNLIADQPVLFRVTRGGGTVRSASSSTPRDTLTVRTNNIGVAAAFWTVGSKPDTNRLQVSAFYQQSPLRGSPRGYTAITSSEDPVTLLRISAPSDTGVIHQPLARPIQVQVVDRHGNGVVNHPVLFTAMYPSMSGQQGKLFTANLADSALSKTINTDAQGMARINYLLSPLRGSNHVRAVAKFNSKALIGSPVDILIEGLPSPAKRLVLLSEAAVTGIAGGYVTVRVRTDNSLGQPVGGHPVQFTVTDAYSSIETAGAKWITLNTVAGSGEAEAAWRLGAKVGAQVNILQIDAGNLDGSPLEIKATVLAGAPYAPACSMTAVDSVIADNLATSRLTVTLKDSFSNPVSGKQVIFTSLDQGLIFEQSSQFSNALGQVTGTVRSNRAGLKRISATLGGETPVEISFANVTFLPGPPKQMAGYSSSAIIVNSGTVTRDSMAVLVTDALQNPVANIPVTFSITSGSGYILESRLSIFTTSTSRLGVASAHLVAGAKIGEPIVVQATSAHPQLTSARVNFVITVVNGVPALVQKHSGDGQTGPAGSELAEPLTVRVIDSKNEPVAHVAIRFTAQESGAEIVSLNPVETDYLGLASARCKLGFRAGDPPQIVGAQIVGSPLSTNFIAYALGQGPAQLEVLSGNEQEGIAGKQIPQPLQVRVADDYGNGVAGVMVHFRLADQMGSGQVAIDSVRTDISGHAALQPVLPTLKGEYIYIATSPELPGKDAAFHCTVQPDAAWRMAKYANDYQSMTAGRELNYPVIVVVTDQYDNRVANESIGFTALDNSGQAVLATVPSDASGLAACRWVLASAPKTNTLMAFKLGLRNSPVQFTALGVLNKFPQFTDLPAQPLRIEYNKPFAMAVKAVDGDGDALRYSVRVAPAVANAVFDSLYSHVFTWKPTVRQKGSYKLNLRVEDGRGGFDVDSLLVSVVGDSAPVFTSVFPADRLLPLTYPQNQLFTCAAIDYDNDPIAFTWYVDGVPRATGPRFEMVSSHYSKGSHYIWVIASDGVKSAQSEMWEIMVDAVELTSFTAAAEPYRGVIVRWSTGRETDNLGFDLLRSTLERGPFVRITTALIPSREEGQYSCQDSSAVAGERYFYMLEDVSRSGARMRHGPIEVSLRLPESFALEQNFPNPFNPQTAIRFQLPKADKVLLVVFNNLGQQVRVLLDSKLNAGYHAVVWDGRSDQGERVGSGIYYYRLVSPRYQEMKKMVLVK